MDWGKEKTVNYIKSLLPPVLGDANESVFESLHVDDIAAQIRPAGPVLEEYRAITERTAEKIARGEALDVEENFAAEAIIIPDKRPAVDVLANGTFTIDHPLWLQYNDGTLKANLIAALPSIGRIELPGNPILPYGGTGFVVGPDLLMTNRHVAELFASGLGAKGLSFIPGCTAGVDFRKSIDGGSLYLAVADIVLIHPYWDLAILRVDGPLDDAKPLKLSSAPLPTDPIQIATIGYPAFDPRNAVDVQNQVFHGIYNVKRLMPGFLKGRRDIGSFGKTVSATTHDSSTLGGASGSAIFDPATAAVMALHFGGIYKDTNFGVPATELARDGRLIDAGLNFEPSAQRGSGPWDAYWASSEATVPSAIPPSPPATPAASPADAPMSATITVPLTVKIAIAIGQPAPPTPTPMPQTPAPVVAPSDEDVDAVEKPVGSYQDREGYVPDFLETPVALPAVVRDIADVLSFDDFGTPGTVLRYQHFSVVMSRSRRQCFFSAVNIDGRQSRKATRSAWHRDPRIPAGAQILNECYGNPPKFSRGHMTRREDPVWGDPATATLGNDDSMHVTNTTPQMQAFNAPIWLSLEDYALQHARTDAMKISVFTGPYFDPGDPVYYGVKVPVAFWKVIVFLHDGTDKLSATGYEMSQVSVLPAEGREFVYGGFVSPQLGVAAQVPISRIATRAGLSFGNLTAHDPLGGAQEGVAGGATTLAMLENIRFA